MNVIKKCLQNCCTITILLSWRMIIAKMFRHRSVQTSFSSFSRSGIISLCRIFCEPFKNLKIYPKIDVRAQLQASGIFHLNKSSCSMGTLHEDQASVHSTLVNSYVYTVFFIKSLTSLNKKNAFLSTKIKVIKPLDTCLYKIFLLSCHPKVHCLKQGSTHQN